MSGCENNPQGGPSPLFLKQKLLHARRRATKVCDDAFDKVEQDDDSLGFLGQLIEIRAELTAIMKTLPKATDAFLLTFYDRYGYGSQTLSTAFQNLEDIETRAADARRRLAYKIWELYGRHGKIDELFASPELNALHMKNTNSDEGRA